MKINDSSISNINAVFESAYEDGRNVLYEYEVYQILNHIGLDVPKFVFVDDPSKINSKMLENFDEKIVVKIVSPHIAHKQKLGGVKIVKNYDPLFLQFVLSRMKEEVLSHFGEDNMPEIKGFLLVEFLPHTQAIGYEVLIGFKEDPAFGPVLTLSKGGDDAEFFARYYDPANLFLPPLDSSAALKMVNTLNIRHKFEQLGHLEYLEKMAAAMSVLSWLSYHYSTAGRKKPEFIIKALDINPFVITNDSRFVAIDGFAEFTKSEEDNKAVQSVNLHNLDGFFRPDGIAVVGVSSDMSKYSLGREIAQLLHDLERDDLYFINTKGGKLNYSEKEYPLYKSLDDVQSNIDLVVYAAPAQFTIDFIRALKPGRVKAVILISGIPSNIKYSDFSKQLSEALPEGLRIIGPNCMGVYFAPEGEAKGLNTLFIDEKRLELKHSAYSNTVLLTQSGALAVTAIDKLQNTRIFKSVVSFGNKYDVKITDLMAYFAKEDSIDLISLYIEGMDDGEGRQFFELAQKISKPVIAYKSGKTEAGAKAAASHTASMSGSYDVFKAACMQTGVILAENIDDHYNFVKVFSLLSGKIPSGYRVAGVLNAGFESTVGADELKTLKQAQLSDATIGKLVEINRHGLADVSSPFLDITPMADDRMYADFVEAVLQDENVDCVFVAIVPHANSLKTTPDTCRDSDSLANLLVGLGKRYSKPMVVSVNAGRYYQDFVSIMETNGLPVFNDIRSSIKSLDAFVSYHVK